MRINFHNSFINWFNRTKINRNSFMAFSLPADSKAISLAICGDTENLMKLLEQINNIIYCFTKKDPTRVTVNSEDKEKAEFMDENIVGENYEITFGRKTVSIKEETKLLCENNDPLSEDYLTFDSHKKYENLFSFGCRVTGYEYVVFEDIAKLNRTLYVAKTIPEISKYLLLPVSEKEIKYVVDKYLELVTTSD